ncbi:TonB family protein [Balneolaceae bacterium YR4-1]|uniref:TonB family protein n=1 Tax=Halalkalibaculum roseum TaxID=2709311 RepID=A0A6M1SXG0_9BACT|nr:TonB family protein [Halalkalibaculum roseum]NGP77750.1 TonB family protein [Halalkalibaculum roseum]
MKFFDNIDEEDRFAIMVTAGIHVVLTIIFILYTFSINQNARPSFIEVEFGEFKAGTIAERSEVKNQEVATRPNPSEIEPEEPQPEEPDPIEKQQETTQETVKPVDAPEQTEEIEEEPIETPETDKVDPKQQSDTQEQEEVTIPPKTKKAETQQEGAETSGDVKGNTGDVNADQGTGNETEKSAPYELQWEGDFDRTARVQPLPQNNSDIEATISIRFEVKPDGTIGRIIPIKKMNPELEREVMSTLRSWRFTRLPSGVPQQSQWGTITFRFVLE